MPGGDPGIPGAAIDERVAFETVETNANASLAGALDDRRLYHLDRLGNVIATASGAGRLKDQYVYTPYGVEESGQSGQPFRYTGRYKDAETGLLYYRARYYDAQIGRFLETDPVGYADQMNLYAYVGNDPLNMVDPTGMAKCASNIEGEECEDVHAAVEGARTQISDTKAAVDDLRQAIASGDSLTDSQESTKAAYEKTFGAGSATRRNLGRTSRTLGRMHHRLGERGRGIRVSSGTADAGIATANNRGITVDTGFFEAAPTAAEVDTTKWDISYNRVAIMIHEGGHVIGKNDVALPSVAPSGIGGMTRAGRLAYGMGAAEWLAQQNSPDVWRNNDNLRCFIVPDQCGS